jgi:hypothetical protein
MTYLEAIEVLFKNYIEECFWDERSEAENIAEECWRYAKGGVEAAERDTVSDLDYRLFCAEDLNHEPLVAENKMKELIAETFRGHDNHEKLCEAALVVVKHEGWIQETANN